MRENKFYHIHKIGKYEELWKEGNIIEFNGINDFFDISMNFTPPESIEIERISDLLNEYQILIREIGYENVRLDEHKNLPSRTKCIWLCKEKQLNFWKEMLKNNKYKIFEVETIEGNLYKTNNNFIAGPINSYNTILKMAKQYWNYTNIEEKENDEYLFCGKLKILRELDEN